MFKIQYSSRKPAPESAQSLLPLQRLGVKQFLQYFLYTVSMCYSPSSDYKSVNLGYNQV